MSGSPDQPIVDKDALIGACVRLGIAVDPVRMRSDLDSIAPDLWGNRGGRVGVHTPTEAIFLRGHAPAEGDKPIEDRPALASLPYIRELIQQRIPAPPMRCLLAKLKPGAIIAPHIDRGKYFGQTLRLHFPIITHPTVLMISRGMGYQMREGEVWALNNSNVHAVINGWDQPRLHLICDFLPTPELESLINSGERNLGTLIPDLDRKLAAAAAYQPE